MKRVALLLLMAAGCSNPVAPTPPRRVPPYLRAIGDPGPRTFVAAKAVGRMVEVFVHPDSGAAPAGLEWWGFTDSYETPFGRHSYFVGRVPEAGLEVMGLACAGIDSNTVNPREVTLEVLRVTWHGEPVEAVAGVSSGPNGERLEVFRSDENGLTALVWWKGNRAWYLARAKAWPLYSALLTGEYP